MFVVAYSAGRAILKVRAYSRKLGNFVGRLGVFGLTTISRLIAF